MTAQRQRDAAALPSQLPTCSPCFILVQVELHGIQTVCCSQGKGSMQCQDKTCAVQGLVLQVLLLACARSLHERPCRLQTGPAGTYYQKHATKKGGLMEAAAVHSGSINVPVLVLFRLT